MEPSSIVVGVAWYRPEQYGLLLALSVDPEGMAKTYDEWLAAILRTMEDLRKRGVVARRVDVDVRILVAWCEERDRPLDGAARAEFAAERVRSDHMG
ncbi:MAG: hypothetical protein JWM16_3634 [Verrucomicrobiales bacterium]|nr:hypothetical protein [Verrucomicrobiales bacterium]